MSKKSNCASLSPKEEYYHVHLHNILGLGMISAAKAQHILAKTFVAYLGREEFWHGGDVLEKEDTVLLFDQILLAYEWARENLDDDYPIEKLL